MEAKPIITCHGNQALFSTLHPTVVSGLPKEVCEWKRSFGRASRSVQLEGSFVPYDPDILPEEDTKTLVSRPYFHIYWTDCDLDGYKQSVRDELIEWQAALKTLNIPDWLIVVVIPDESKVKAKLLPRSSVIDKVRNDFCNKQPERSIVLTEPSKTEPKSVESWNQLFHKLRRLLLQAYNRHLNKYEENMRSLREKRNEPGWTYFEYFAVQEELGFMLEVLGLREDALIQYDELDAMFGQFVENHISGDAVNWLSPLLQPCTNWNGLSLAKPIDLELRDRVKRTTISLLEFRNYLFCRQAALLFSLGRAWEVANRAFEFLRNTVIEMKSLEVSLPEGALQCWVVLSGLEVLTACQKHETGQVDKCSVFTAHLWDFIRDKLKDLGHLCSLMPGMVPTSEQLNQVLDLKSGMTPTNDEESSDGTNAIDKLHGALCSPDAFKKLYLEICELAMGTYKHVSQFRSARKIGRELARFYMNIGEPQKAEAFLLDAVKMYRHEGWQSLAHATMRELATCQKQMGHIKRFLVTACKVACSRHLPNKDRDQFFNDVMESLKTGHSVQLDSSDLLEVRQLQLKEQTVKVGEDVLLTVRLVSWFPQSLTCDSVQLALMPCALNQQVQHQIGEQPPAAGSQIPQTVIVRSEKPPLSQALRRAFPNILEIKALYEQRQGQMTVVGIACKNAQDLLKRTDSIPTGAEMSSVLVKGDYTSSLSGTRIVLNPGENELQLTMKATEEGQFTTSQMCVHVKGLEILVPLSCTNLSLRVACYRPFFKLKPKHTEQFIAGIEQMGTLTLYMGSQSINSPTKAILKSSCPVVFTSAQGEKGEPLQLAAQGPHTAVDTDVRVFLPLENAAIPEGASCQTTEVECCIDGWSEAIQSQVNFVLPLCASHRIYTSRDKKYVQIKLSINTVTPVTIAKPALSAIGTTFTFMNPDIQWVVCPGQDVSLAWQIAVDAGNDDADVNATFNCDFSCDLDVAKQSHTFVYNCCLTAFQTWYMIEYNLSGEATITASVPGTQLSSKSIKCTGYQSGITYAFYLTVTPVGANCSMPQPQQLVYKVTADPGVWAFSGKTTGVCNIGNKPFRTSLKVIPLAAGYQHLPRVHLYHLADVKDKSAEHSDDIWVKRAEVEESNHEMEQANPASEPDSDCDLDFGSELEEFSRGRVYNASLAKQVHVFPTPASSDMEVTVVT